MCVKCRVMALKLRELDRKTMILGFKAVRKPWL
jgi:hypothetical protein